MEKEELIDYVKKQIDKAKADYDKPYQDEWELGEAFGRRDAYEDILNKLLGGKS